jgi:bifunctional enzyme CysN/CysC
LQNFTGIDSPYEPPENADIRVDTTTLTPEDACEQIVDVLRRLGRLHG